MAERSIASRHVQVARRWSWMTRWALARGRYPLPWPRRFTLKLSARLIGLDLVRSDLWTSAKNRLWIHCTLSTSATRDKKGDSQ